MNSHSTPIAIASVSLILALACNLPFGQKPTPRPTPIPAEALSLTSQRPVALAEGRPVSLSPDGQWLLVNQAKAVCLYATASLTQQSCAEWSGGLAATNIGWAPDSHRVAFSENVQLYFKESDVWVMETGTGQLTDRTEDGLTGGDWIHDPDAQLDYAPAFAPDSQSLIFFRVETSGTIRPTRLYTLPNAGQPQKLATLVTEPFSTYWRPIWSSDGQQIFYTRLSPEWEDAQNGIWVVAANGENARHLLPPSPELGAPILLGVTPKADKALVLYSSIAVYAVQPDQDYTDYLVLLDVESGESEPAILAEPSAGAALFPVAATFSPDGSKILYSYINRIDHTTTLAVRDLEGTREHVLLTQAEPLGQAESIVAELVWATNNLIFTNTPPDQGVLLQLGQ